EDFADLKTKLEHGSPVSPSSDTSLATMSTRSAVPQTPLPELSHPLMPTRSAVPQTPLPELSHPQIVPSVPNIPTTCSRATAERETLFGPKDIENHQESQQLDQPTMMSSNFFSPDLKRSLKDNVQPFLEHIEKIYLDACMQANLGRVNTAAKMAGISRRTLLRKLNQHNINKMDYR
ncbi:MAG: helix-turn-helix domain-containing protein, partial [Myxococcota bacterium]